MKGKVKIGKITYEVKQEIECPRCKFIKLQSGEKMVLQSNITDESTV